MKPLQSVKLKPNPAGKDKTKSGNASAAQLAGEWVDIKNTGTAAVDVTGVVVRHVAYSDGGRTSKWEEFITFTRGTLSPGEVVRVHSGSGPESVLKPADAAGATHHVFTGKNYIWNNDYSDCSGLFEASQPQPFDTVCYDAYPPEGEILVRSNGKLVPSGAPVARR